MSLEHLWIQNNITSERFEALRKHYHPDCSLSYQDSEGYPFIDRAIAIGHVILVEYFFKQAPGLINAYDKRGKTFLFKAMETSRVHVIEKLLELGADPSMVSASSESSVKVSALVFALFKDKQPHSAIQTTLLLTNGYPIDVEKIDAYIEAAACLGDPSPERLPILREQLTGCMRSGLKELCLDPIRRMNIVKEILAGSPLLPVLAQIVAKYLFPWEVRTGYEKYLGDTGTSVLAGCVGGRNIKDFEHDRTFFPLYKLADEDCHGNTILHYTVSNSRDPVLIRYLIGNEPQLLHKCNNRGESVLCFSIRHNDISQLDTSGRIVAELLIELGIQIHSFSKSSRTDKILPLLATAIYQDRLRAPLLQEADFPTKSYTWLLLESGYQADLTQSSSLVDVVLLELCQRPTYPDYQEKAAAIHTFLKRMFIRLGQEFCMKRSILISALLDTTYMLPKIIGLIADYYSLKDWSHIPGADTYLA